MVALEWHNEKIRSTTLIAWLCAGLVVCVCLAALWQGSSAHFIAACCFVELLAVVSAIDIHVRLIPHVAIAAALGMCFAAACVNVVGEQEVLVSCVVQVWFMFCQGLFVALPLAMLAFAMKARLGKDVFGAGDIKLMFVLACFLGWEGALLVLGIACVASLVCACVTRMTSFPFAPFLTIGCWVVLLIGA